MSEYTETYWSPLVPELSTTDFIKSLNFYVEILGFEILIRRENPDFAYITLGKAQLMLEQIHSEGWNTAELVKPLGRGINFQIEIDDIYPLLSKIKKLNVPLFRDLSDNFYETNEGMACQKEFLIQDPDGYLLRFSQYIETT